VTTFPTASRARLRRARPDRARPGLMHGRRKSPDGIASWSRGNTAAGWRGNRGARLLRGGSMPRPTGGSPPGAAMPPVGCPRARRQAVPAPTRRQLPSPASPNRAALPAPGILSPRKDHRQGHVASGDGASATLDADLPRQNPAPVGRTDRTRLGPHVTRLNAGSHQGSRLAKILVSLRGDVYTLR
jgi:hypothetical protein